MRKDRGRSWTVDMIKEDKEDLKRNMNLRSYKVEMKER